MIVEVCFAACIPATRATARISPFLLAAVERSSEVDVWDGEKWTVATATATREVVGLAAMDTMRASPDDERCVNCGVKASLSRSEHAGRVVLMFRRALKVIAEFFLAT